MKAVSDTRGVIAAAAMDQRGSLQKALAKERGGTVDDKAMEEFKILVTEVLTRHASAILLDPEWGIPASKRRAKNSGLLMAYEKTGYDAATPGRLPDLLDLWSVRRIKEVGADCLKILLYYAPSDPQKINEHKHAWVERIGDECRANDIPFFLEIIAYEEGADAFRQWLETEGVKNIANVNARLAPAHPWYEFYGAKSAEELAGS